MAKTSWTEGRTHTFIISVLRWGSRKWPPKFNVLDAAKTEKKKSKHGRIAQHYKCNACNGEFTSTDVQVDHIIPVVDPEKGFVSWDEYIPRLFCGEDNLQVLCTTCHDKKTAEEKGKKNGSKQNSKNS